MSDRVKQSIFEVYDPESPAATELRRLFSNMTRKTEGRASKSFLVTSSNRGEGKSTVSSLLALTIAQFPKKRVLLVDADLRRPRVHKLYGLKNDQGLTECLSSSIDPRGLVKKTELSNLDILTAGVPDRSPSQLFESEDLARVFDQLEFYYDVVLVDSAPIIPVSDTLFLSKEIQWVLFVVLAGVTPKTVVQRARDILLDGQANILGIVVNNVSEVLPYYYDYKYYGYKYEVSKEDA